MNVKFIKGKRTKPFEYFCYDCKQLRLSYIMTIRCANCGGYRIIKGAINSLDKAKLVEQTPYKP